MAVYTDISADQIKEFLVNTPLGAYRKHQGITQGVENSNFFLSTKTGTYILTIVEKRTDPKDLPFIFSYMRHMFASGIPVPNILARGTIGGKPAVIVQLLEGSSIYDDHTSPDHCAQVGETLARMHKASERFTEVRVNPVGVPQWQSMFDAVKDRIDPTLAAVIAGELAICACADWQKLPRGAVHADLFRDNVFFNEKGLLSGVIDFYFACTSAYAYDLAITINAWCFDRNNRLMPARLDAMIKAYTKIRPLSAHERAMFPALRKAAALRFLMTRLYDQLHTPQGATVVKKDPLEYLDKLRAQFPWQ